MSFIICCATSEYGAIASVGRVVNFDTEEIICDNYPKIRKINDNLIIGFAGGKEIGEKSIEYAIKKNCPKNISVENLSETLRAILQLGSNDGMELMNTTFYVLGKTDYKTVAYNTVAIIDGKAKIIKHEPISKDDLQISCCGCELDDNPIPMIRKYLLSHGVEKGLTLAIRNIANTQATVGREVYISSL